MSFHRFLFLSVILLVSLVASEEDVCATDLAKALSEKEKLTFQVKEHEETVNNLRSTQENTNSELNQLKTKATSLEVQLKTAGKALQASEIKLQQYQETCNVAEFESCKDNLQLNSEAKKQLEVELGNSFARVEILSAEIKQLNGVIKTLKGSIEEKDTAVGVLQKELEKTKKVKNQKLTDLEKELEKTKKEQNLKVNVLQKELEETQRQLSEKLQSSTFTEFKSTAALQLSKLSPYWKAATDTVVPAIEAAMSSNVVQQAAEIGRRIGDESKEAISGLYEKASPHISDAFTVGKHYGQIVFEKSNEIYSVAKPTVEKSLEISKKVTMEGFQVAQSFTVQTMSVIRQKSVEFYRSQFVSDLKKQSAETVLEIEDYVRTQMDQIPALQPFAKSEYASIVAYSLLAIPPLAILTLLFSCFTGRSSSDAKNATKKAKSGGKKVKKQRHT